MPEAQNTGQSGARMDYLTPAAAAKVERIEAAHDDDCRIGGDLARHGNRNRAPRRGGHQPDPPPCALCDGYGDICNPGNADPARKVTEWLPPVGCPRCGQSGKDPNP